MTGSGHAGTSFWRPFVKRFALCYQTTVCLSCLSVMLVYCGQTVGWIKMKLGMEVGLGPGHIVHAAPLILAHVLWPNGCIDRDVTWYGDRSRPRPYCVRWSPAAPPRRPERGVHSRPPLFGTSVVAKRSSITATAELLLKYAGWRHNHGN